MNLTIGITSCNRKKYVYALLNSIEELSASCQIVMVDNGSQEQGLVELLEDYKEKGIIHNLFLRKERDWINDEYIAKNIIIDNAKYDTILFLQDDCQFIGNKEILEKVLNDFNERQELCLEVSGVRKCTLSDTVYPESCFTGASGFKYWYTINNHFQTMGFFKKFVFDNLGPYPTDWPQEKAYWGRSEDYYDSLLKTRTQGHFTIKAHVPLFVTVWNDPRGGYAFIRDDKRYGHYIDADEEAGVYYEKLTNNEYEYLSKTKLPAAFVDVAKPIKWEYQKSPEGDQIKYAQSKVLVNGPISNF
tara:strand:+ start:1639 stop:2544 length:906 start_codon:yes stop_codon:yes gene_type:complete